MSKYSIGVDFGSLSGRAVLVDVSNGEELCTATYEYPHGVMDEELPCGKKLEADYALQHPQDYVEVLSHTIPALLRQSGIAGTDVIGLGVDFTSCTILPVTEDGTPLCFLEEYMQEPHAYVKLWKHHAAQKQANHINALAAQRQEPWLKRYGGKISSEWMFPKVLQILEEREELYDRTARFVEGGDWIVWQMTGAEVHSSCQAGYKAMWHKQDGYPSGSFFRALHPKLESIIGTKISTHITPVGSCAGGLCARMAKLTGLPAGTPVAVGTIDAHVAVPAVGITGPGKMLMIMGTSTCHIVMSGQEQLVPGMCGVVEDGVLPSYYGYEAGQSCVGDHFDWFVKQCVPYHYIKEANGQNIHSFLREKAKRLAPGESGLLALDWWNGSRSVLMDADLTGMIVGMTLATKPEEIYRALLEATAYGTRTIIDAFVNSGVPVEELYAAGGIAEKDELMMQIYADVTNREIKISGSPQAPALGSAIFGAVAGGYFPSVAAAAAVMAKVKDRIYRPIPAHVEIYQKLYEEYMALHDYFGRGSNDVMKRLKRIRQQVYKSV